MWLTPHPAGARTPAPVATCSRRGANEQPQRIPGRPSTAVPIRPRARNSTAIPNAASGRETLLARTATPRSASFRSASASMAPTTNAQPEEGRSSGRVPSSLSREGEAGAGPGPCRSALPVTSGAGRGSAANGPPFVISPCVSVGRSETPPEGVGVDWGLSNSIMDSPFAAFGRGAACVLPSMPRRPPGNKVAPRCIPWHSAPPSVGCTPSRRAGLRGPAPYDGRPAAVRYLCEADRLVSAPARYPDCELFRRAQERQAPSARLT